MTGYMSLLALGVPMACVRYLAQHVDSKASTTDECVIGSCVGLYLMIGAAALVLGLVVAAVLTVAVRHSRRAADRKRASRAR